MKPSIYKCSFLVGISFLLMTPFMSLGQFVTINASNKFMVGSCPIYFNGANTPWQNWNDFGGSYNSSFWSMEFARLKASGLNSTRIWITCNGSGQPSINGSGVTTSVSAQFWSNCDDMFSSAQANGIYIMATMMSFDHTKNGNPNATNWQNMLNSQTNVQSFVDNFIVPFVNRYKTNPYLWSIDACNEIEWIYENRVGFGDGSQWSGATYPILQRYVAMVANGVHLNPRADGTKVLVTMGSASMKWNSPSYSTGNKWNDAALKAQYNTANAVLDFYSPHYYGWMYSYFQSPFDRTVAQYAMTDKAVVIGEMSSVATLPTPNMAILTAFNNMKAGGYQGHLPWTSNLVSTSSEIGTLTDFGPASLSFKNANTNLVYPPSSCLLPLTFLDIHIETVASNTILYWTILQEAVHSATFEVFGSKDGFHFTSLSSHPFTITSNTYMTEVDSKNYQYFYISCNYNNSLKENSKIVEVPKNTIKIYSISYNSEKEPSIHLLETIPCQVTINSLDGRILLDASFSTPTSIQLASLTKQKGIYLVRIIAEENYHTEKIALP